jgi:hypothetical protein
MPKTCTITLQPNTMDVLPSPGLVLDPLPRENVAAINGVFNQKPLSATQEEWAYPFPTMTILVIKMKDGRDFSVELQDVTNQATWSTGLKSGLNQAIADIKAWI